MTEEELKALDKEVKKLKRISSEWASQLHDLVEERLPAGYKEIPGIAHPLTTRARLGNWRTQIDCSTERNASLDRGIDMANITGTTRGGTPL